MSYAFYYDVPGNEQIFHQVNDRIGDSSPDGLISMVVTQTDEGIRHLNVWESQEQWMKFRDNAVGPAVAAVLTEMGIPAPTEPPVVHELNLVYVGP